MASGLPVICATDEAFKNVVIDDLNGKEFSNKKQYKKCIEELLKDDNKLKMMSRQARITADSHSLRYYADKILYVYNCAINSNKGHDLLDKIKNTLKRGKDE